MMSTVPITTPESVDIAVIGGGMVGGTLVVSLCDMLRDRGYAIALIDVQPAWSARTPDADPRTTAVSFASRQILSALGCWQEDASPIRTVNVSHQGYLGKVRMTAAELGVPAVGYVINNTAYLNHLNDQIERCVQSENGLQHLTSCTVTGIDQHDDSATLTLDHNGNTRSLNARLVIAADGARSSLRSLCDLRSLERDYEQVGIISTVSLDRPHNGVAYERFVAHGPVALLPVGTHDASLVLTTDPSHAAELMALSDAAFLRELQSMFSRRVGRFTRVGQRTDWPLFLVDSELNAVGRVLFVGNAARTLHPVAGQGFNLAVRDIGALVALLRNGTIRSQSTASEALLSREAAGIDPADIDPGQADLLNDFARSREQDQQRTIRLTDSLARLFRGANPAMSHLRSAGLLSLDRLPGARQQFGRAAMGLSAGLPDLPYPD